MLFYGKQIDFTYIILIVVLISAVYIIYSFYQEQKETIQVVSLSQPIMQPKTVPIPNNVALSNGAFAVSLWVNLNSSPQFTATGLGGDASKLNLMRLTNANSTNANSSSTAVPTVPVTLLNLTIDNNGNLGVSYLLNSSNQMTTIMLFPIGESVNIVLNYNGDDDIDPDKSETVYDPTTNKNIPIYNPDAKTFYNGSKRALDVYINGLLNNTISVDTLTNSKVDPDSPPYITYMDASMNYITTNGNQIVVGDNQPVTLMDGTISNAAFIKDGCSPQDVLSIFNQGESGSILENLLSYKLRFSFIEDNKEMKTYDFL